MKRSSIRTGSRWLRSSRPSSARPKLYSKYSGVHGADSGSLRIHTRRSRPIAAISSRHTRRSPAPAAPCTPTAVASSADCERLQRLRHTRGRQRQPLVGVQRAQHAGLHFVKERAARQRIEPLQRLRRLVRREAIDRRQDELVRAGRELLQRRDRVRARPEPLRVEHRLDCRRDAHEAVLRQPARPRAHPAPRDRAAERGVEAEEVVRVAANRRPVGRVDEQAQRRQIVLDLVDRVLGPRRRRPVELRAAGRRRLPLELFVVRDLADDGAHDVEHVERRHARAGAADVEARIGQPEAIGRGADGEAEQQALGLRAIVLDDEVRPSSARAARASPRRAAADPRAASAERGARRGRARTRP